MTSDSKKARIILVGGHNLGCTFLNYLLDNDYCVVLCIARYDDSGIDDVFPSLKNLAVKRQVPLIQPTDINHDTALVAARDASPDIVLSIVNNMVFRTPWFDLVESRLGIVNVHYGPLPRYGGYWPEMWAIWNEEKDFAVTLHYVSPKLDEGALVAQCPVDIAADDTRQSLYYKCDATALRMITDNIDRLLTARVAGQIQDASKRSYFRRGLPNDGFVDLSWPQEKIERFIRAVSFPPFTGPKIRIGDHVYTIIAEDLPFYKRLKVEHG